MKSNFFRFANIAAATATIAAVGMFIAGCDHNELTPRPQTIMQATSVPEATQVAQNSTTAPAVTGPAKFTLAEVATHNTAADCWLILDGKVYNVSTFISEHPGGARAITSRCGTDATQAFANIGHSSSAMAMKDGYYIGDLSQ